MERMIMKNLQYNAIISSGNKFGLYSQKKKMAYLHYRMLTEHVNNCNREMEGLWKELLLQQNVPSKTREKAQQWLITCCVSLVNVQYQPTPSPFSVASFVFKACTDELLVAVGAA
eukprot:14285494-Ditylum_brightwellii.AAC.1